ncbi:hypothetical protein [Luteolibacter sp. Populi]|uniref:hypothetical protein n=1 Tax=Luteolibacter sp. Populi TaxID=3230487 RepID=UPI003467D76F
MRAQYHLRNSDRGLLAWDVRRLIALTSDLTAFDLPLNEIQELDECFWFAREGDTPTCRKIADHAKLIAGTDLSYPIIVDPAGRVMDGMHRVCKAVMENRTTVRAVRLPVLPEPDFVGVEAKDLPYLDGINSP